MSPQKFALSFLGNTASAAAVALMLAAPSGAMAGTAERNGTAAHHIRNAASTTTDISAAHRRHVAHRRTSARAAYGSMIGGPVYEAPAYQGGYPGYGYGVGDNSNSYAQ
jgi:hypothetical protein